uniref:Leucine rich repeat containing 18b n=1 Tax=Maylandia zebra TaxID=106582 RepID=A0A3P9DF05_9CICH
MAKGTKAKRKTKSKKITLKMAQNCVELTLDGKPVPKCIQKLFHMDEVDLSRNMIRQIPDFIAQFIKMTLPVAIGYLQNLKVLNLCNNRLTSLPSELGLLNKLQTLNLGLNQLEALPASIGALEDLRHIGLFDNRFTRLPSCLLKLKKLESIKMDRNPIIAEKIPTEKPVSISESFYLVKESFLCKECLNRCQAERKRAAESTLISEYLSLALNIHISCY